MDINFGFRFALTLSSRYYNDLHVSNERSLLLSGFLDCLVYSGYIFDHDKSIIYNRLVYGDSEAHMGLPD